MGKSRVLVFTLLLLLGAGCAGLQPLPVKPTALPPLPPATLALLPTSTPPAPAATPEEVIAAEPTLAQRPPVADHAGLPLPTDRGELFSASGACAICHTQLVDAGGADVSIDAFWRSTMMANAARDPYWQASVREEVLDHPALGDVVEDTCAKCHMPMARFTAATVGGQGDVLDGGFLEPGHNLHALALDGVSCTLCHQVEEDNFGQVDSFSGGYVVDTDLPAGERVNYGPFPVGKAWAAQMQAASGFWPVESAHVEQAGLCATCHTLYTPYVDAEGQVAGEFPEQTPYLEWRHSDYADGIACQNCHMPLAQGEVQLSMTGGPPRGPFFRHNFVGGNVFMLDVLNIFGPDIGVTAGSEAFLATRERALDQIGQRTASVDLESATLADRRLTAVVSVESQVGHKFPSGFPSRRAWLHITVVDAGDRVVFESGGFGSDGSIDGNDNDADAGAYESHYTTIVSPDQVQIYEAIMRNTEEHVTTALLEAAEYVKDNRLLPAGFDKETATADIGVYGEAATDADFQGGGDRVKVVIDVGDAQGPFVVSAELLYQSIGYRWAQNMQRHEADEITRFMEYYQAVPNVPAVVASVTLKVED
jgi:hypothetical protein